MRFTEVCVMLCADHGPCVSGSLSSLCCLVSYLSACCSNWLLLFLSSDLAQNSSVRFHACHMCFIEMCAMLSAHHGPSVSGGCLCRFCILYIHVQHWTCMCVEVRGQAVGSLAMPFSEMCVMPCAMGDHGR